MRPSRPTSPTLATLALGALALAAGCGGPELQIKALNGEDQGKVFFRPVFDRDGNEFPPSTPETAIGEMPTDWEIPENLLDGQGAARVVYEDGAEKKLEQFKLLKTKDTVIRVTRPMKPRK